MCAFYTDSSSGMCICVAVILLEGGTEFDLQTLNPAAEGQQQINRLASSAGFRMYFKFQFTSVVLFCFRFLYNLHSSCELVFLCLSMSSFFG